MDLRRRGCEPGISGPIAAGYFGEQVEGGTLGRKSVNRAYSFYSSASVLGPRGPDGAGRGAIVKYRILRVLFVPTHIESVN